MLDLKQVASESKRRVLVVDDHYDTAEVLAVMLEMLGHEARCAHRGEEALGMVREWVPDLVLLDIGLPDMSGHQVARLLRADPVTAHCDIIAITCWDTSDDVVRSKNAGCDVHITKPLALDKLQSLLSVKRARSRPRSVLASDVQAQCA